MRKLSAVLVAALVLVGCGEGGFDLFGSVGSGGDPWESRLAELPNPGDDRDFEIIAWDQQRAFEVAGLDPDDGQGFFEATRTGEIFPIVPDVLDVQTWGVEGFREGNGYDRSDVEWGVELMSLPAVVATLGGDFDLAELEEVNGPAENGSIVPDDTMALRRDDAVPGRPLGRTPRYDLDGDQLTVSRGVEDPTEGPRATDHEGIMDLARVLDDVDAYTAHAFFRQEWSTHLRGVVEQLPDDLRAISMLPQPYLGTGVAILEPDDDGDQAVMIFLHEDDDAAEVNATALTEVLQEGEVFGSRRPWSQVVTDVEVAHDERAVVATVRFTDAANPRFLLQQLYGVDLVPAMVDYE